MKAEVKGEKHTRITKIFNRLYSSGKKQFITVICVAVGAALLLSGVSYIHDSKNGSMVLTLNYASSRNGLTPGGAKFDIGDIKSDDVLQSTVNILNDDSLSVALLKPRITIDTKLPKSAIEKTTTAIASSTSYSYYPSEFEILYKQKGIFGNARTFMEALSEAYMSYFKTHYALNNSILDFDEDNLLEKYDYNEVCTILDDRVSMMLTYLSKYARENSAWRSQTTGYSYTNLTAMLTNIRTVDIAKLEAYITQNGISHDRAEFLRKQQYHIDKNSILFSKVNKSSELANDALDIYNAHITGVAFIPAVDDNNEFYMGRTKTGLDTLVMKSEDDGLKATEYQQVIDEHQYLIDKYETAPEPDMTVNERAEAMIDEICDYLKKISTLAIQTDDDYVEDKTNNYLTFIYDEQPIIKYIAIFAIMFVFLMCALTLLINDFDKIRLKIKGMKDFAVKIIRRRIGVSGNEN